MKTVQLKTPWNGLDAGGEEGGGEWGKETNSDRIGAAANALVIS